MITIITICSIVFAVAHGSLLAKRAQFVGRDTTLKFSYDFLIVGGGTSGLTVADRLTENPNSAWQLFLYFPMVEAAIMLMCQSIGACHRVWIPRQPRTEHCSGAFKSHSVSLQYHQHSAAWAWKCYVCGSCGCCRRRGYSRQWHVF